MKEIWKDIPGHENRYQVSNMGRVKSLEKRVKLRDTTRVVRERILKQSVNPNGYKKVSLGNNTQRLVHRLVLQAFIGESDLHVDHLDSNKQNNKLYNLEYVTPTENNIRMHGNPNGPYVYFEKSSGKWMVVVTINKKRIYGGRFACVDQAKNKRDEILCSQ